MLKRIIKMFHKEVILTREEMKEYALMIEAEEREEV